MPLDYDYNKEKCTMGTYYDFMVEAKYKGTWHNIDFHSPGLDGRMRHRPLATISGSFLGLLEEPVHAAAHLTFEELSESTQEILLKSALPQREDAMRLNHYFLLGDLEDFERLATSPYQFELYVTRNQVAQFERGDLDDIPDGLSAQELLELPEEARREYVLYRWDYPCGTRETVKYMLEKVREQLELFNNSIPYRRDLPRDELHASAVRILFSVS